MMNGEAVHPCLYYGWTLYSPYYGLRNLIVQVPCIIYDRQKSIQNPFLSLKVGVEKIDRAGLIINSLLPPRFLLLFSSRAPRSGPEIPIT